MNDITARRFRGFSKITIIRSCSSIWLILSISARLVETSGYAKLDNIRYEAINGYRCDGLGLLGKFSECDPSFTICFSTKSPQSNCTETPTIKDSSMIDFSQSFPGYSYGTKFSKWTEYLNITIQFVDHNLIWQRSRYDSLQYIYSGGASCTKISQNVNGNKNRARMLFSLRVCCDTNFFGPQCDKYCVGTPHGKCDHIGNLVCSHGYTGDRCEKILVTSHSSVETSTLRSSKTTLINTTSSSVKTSLKVATFTNEKTLSSISNNASSLHTASMSSPSPPTKILTLIHIENSATMTTRKATEKISNFTNLPLNISTKFLTAIVSFSKSTQKSNYVNATLLMPKSTRQLLITTTTPTIVTENKCSDTSCLTSKTSNSTTATKMSKLTTVPYSSTPHKETSKTSSTRPSSMQSVHISTLNSSSSPWPQSSITRIYSLNSINVTKSNYSGTSYLISKTSQRNLSASPTKTTWNPTLSTKLHQTSSLYKKTTTRISNLSNNNSKITSLRYQTKTITMDIATSNLSGTPLRQSSNASIYSTNPAALTKKNNSTTPFTWNVSRVHFSIHSTKTARNETSFTKSSLLSSTSDKTTNMANSLSNTSNYSKTLSGHPFTTSKTISLNPNLNTSFHRSSIPTTESSRSIPLSVKTFTPIFTSQSTPTTLLTHSAINKTVSTSSLSNSSKATQAFSMLVASHSASAIHPGMKTTFRNPAANSSSDAKVTSTVVHKSTPVQIATRPRVDLSSKATSFTAGKLSTLQSSHLTSSVQTMLTDNTVSLQPASVTLRNNDEESRTSAGKKDFTTNSNSHDSSILVVHNFSKVTTYKANNITKVWSTSREHMPTNLNTVSANSERTSISPEKNRTPTNAKTDTENSSINIKDSQCRLLVKGDGRSQVNDLKRKLKELLGSNFQCLESVITVDVSSSLLDGENGQVVTEFSFTVQCGNKLSSCQKVRQALLLQRYHNVSLASELSTLHLEEYRGTVLESRQDNKLKENKEDWISDHIAILCGAGGAIVVIMILIGVLIFKVKRNSYRTKSEESLLYLDDDGATFDKSRHELVSVKPENGNIVFVDNPLYGTVSDI